MLLEEQLKERAKRTDAEGAIAQFILDKGVELRQWSSRQIAARVYAAPSTVVRLCQKLGYSGYSDFREDWVRQQEYLADRWHTLDANRPFGPEDSSFVVGQKLGALYCEMVQDTLRLLDARTLDQAVNYCRQAGVIYLCSGGVQVDLAEGFVDKMAKIGCTVVLSSHVDRMLFYACNCSPRDCFILISYSGETISIARVAEKLAQRQVRTITITAWGSNTLSEMFSCNLYMSARERLANNLGSFGAHLTALYLLDVLYAGVFNQNYDQNLQRKARDSELVERDRHSDNPLLQD